MRCSGVAPAACLQRVLTLVVMAWRLALLGVICSVARVPWCRARWHKVCPKKSKPWARGVMTVFVADSRTPRSAKKAVIRGRMVSSKTCRASAVTMKSRVKEWLSDRRAGLAVAAGFPLAVPHEPSPSRVTIPFPSHRTFSFPEYGGPTVFIAHHAQVSPGT